MSSRKRWLVLSLFVLSGAIGLIYETLWIRVLALGVGSTSAAMSMTLAVFFLGLSLGSFFSGRISMRLTRPLFLYGCLETLLGIIALVVIFPLYHLQEVLRIVPLGSLSFFGMLFKFLSVATFLLLPTVCMGATLPLLVRLFEEKEENLGVSVGLLYGLNTIGAVLGALITGYIFIPEFGVVQSNTIAALLNIVLGAIAIFAGKKITVPVKHVTKQNVLAVKLKRQDLVLLGAAGMCGFVSIAGEIIWNKYLNIFFGTNLYGIGLVLSLFLLGIAVGSFIISEVLKKTAHRETLAVSGVFLAVLAMLASSVLFNQAPKASLLLYYYSQGFISLLFAKTIVTTLILFLPTTLFGALFPLLISLLSKGRDDGPAIVGLAYSVNTIGAILGSYLAGIVLVPHLGSATTMQLCLCLLAVTGLALAFQFFQSSKSRGVSAVSTLVVTVAILYFGALDFKNLIKSAYQQKGTHTSATLKRNPEALQKTLSIYHDDYEDFKAIYEGETSVISLSHDPQDGENYRQYLRLKTSGLNESVYDTKALDVLPKYEALIGFLPYLFTRSPKTAFLVGYGGGFTVDFLTSTDLQKVNVVELEKSILKAANYVYEGNNPILKRKNLNLQIEDARYVLGSRTLPPQDIIVSQPSHSWLPGAANLFTKEFFEIVYGNLSDNGVFSQWLNLYNMDVDVLKSILKTFYSVFPHGAVFTQVGDQELVLLGSKRPIEMNLQKLDLIRANPTFKRKLSYVFANSSFDVLSLYSVSREDVVELTKDSSFNTDRNAFAEVRQSRIFYDGLGTKQTPQSFLSALYKGDYSALTKGKDSPQFYYNLLLSLNEGGQYDKFFTVLRRYEEKVKTDPKAYWNLGYLTAKAERHSSSIKYYEKALQIEKAENVVNGMLSQLRELGHYPEMVSVGRKYLRNGNRLTECYLADAMMETGRNQEAEKLITKIVKDIPGYTKVCEGYVNSVVGKYYFEKKDYETATPFLVAFYQGVPRDIANLKRLVVSYQALQDTKNLHDFKEYLPRALESEVKRLGALIEYYRGVGLEDDATALAEKAARLSTPILSE